MTWCDGFSAIATERLADHSPLRVGGPCGAYVVVHERDAYPRVLAWCREQGLKPTLIGAGTRTVFRDGGLAGAVIRLGTGFGRVSRDETGFWIGAAVPLAVMSTLPDSPEEWQSLRRAPGSLGASLMHDPVWEPWVDRVRYIHRGRERDNDLQAALAAGKRTVVLEAHVRTDPLATEGSCGLESVQDGAWFVSSSDVVVADMMGRAALAGTRLRDVAIPAAAPCLMVNLGGGTARDVELLTRSATERIFKETGEKVATNMVWMGKTS